MLRHMRAWARAQPCLDWLDLHVLAGNQPAQRLYESLGFQRLVSVEDMFRVDGESIADTIMTTKLRA
jgi:ribosomal protein S18 acetylase RimI-like enzyme